MQQTHPENALNNPCTGDAPDIQAVVTWLLACDCALRPPTIDIEQYPDTPFPDQSLVGIPISRRTTGIAADGMRSGAVRFSRIAGSTRFNGEYRWGCGCGAGYLLDWNPQTGAISGSLVWVE